MTDDWGDRTDDDGAGDWGAGDGSDDEKWPDPSEIGSTPDVRRYAILAVAGVVAPLATVFAVATISGAYGLPWVVPLFVLLLAPPLSALSLLVALLQSGYALPVPDWVPGAEWFDRPGLGSTRGPGDGGLPQQYRNAMPPADRASASEADAPAPRLARAALLYLLAVPAHALLVGLVAGL